jgi:hypothetical protein
LTGEGRAHHGVILREATKPCEAGKIVPRLDPQHFTLETIGDAYALIENGLPLANLLSILTPRQFTDRGMIACRLVCRRSASGATPPFAATSANCLPISDLVLRVSATRTTQKNQQPAGNGGFLIL